MKRNLNSLLVSAALTTLAAGANAQISDGIIKIGVMNDMSGVYADVAGPGSVTAAKMAIEDFGAAAKGMKVEVVSADHQNKPDVGSTLARQWYDVDKVDAIFDVPTSSVALAISEISKEKGKAFINSGAATSDLTGKACSPNTVHWTYDTWMLANGTGSAIVKTGGNTWFFLTADYAFGHALERDTEAVVLKSGGKVLGKVRHPLNSQDFSSFLLQAQASKAKIVGLANAGGDTQNAIKQAAEFGITKGGQNLAGLLVFLTDIHALGLQTAQGLIVTNTFYWDQNDQSRAFAKRFDAPGRKWLKQHSGEMAGGMAVERCNKEQRAELDGCVDVMVPAAAATAHAPAFSHPRSLKGRVNVAALAVDDPNGDDVA
jgi:branched-chain amino acid transport system substrate-binding protein